MAIEEGTRFQVLAPIIRGRKGEFIELFKQLQAQGFSRARINGEIHTLDDTPTLEQAEEAHHRGRHRPARGQEVLEAPADRLGGDRAQPGRRPGGGRLRRPARQGPRPRGPVLREDGLPQRAPDRHRRARAPIVLLQLAVRCLPRVPRPRHPHGGRPRAGRRRPVGDAGGGRDPAVERCPRGRILRPAAGRPRRRARLRPGHPVGEAVAGPPDDRPRGPPDQGSRPQQEPLRP